MIMDKENVLLYTKNEGKILNKCEKRRFYKKSKKCENE